MCAPHAHNDRGHIATCTVPATHCPATPLPRVLAELDVGAPTPGPGRYDTMRALDAPKPLSMPPAKAGFSTATGRFAAPAGGAPGAYTPGPGYYETAPGAAGGAGGVVRKSFNITYAAAVHA